MMPLKTKKYDTSEYAASPEAQAELVADALETGDAAYITHVLGVIARARGMTSGGRVSGGTAKRTWLALDPALGRERLRRLGGGRGYRGHFARQLAHRLDRWRDGWLEVGSAGAQHGVEGVLGGVELERGAGMQLAHPGCMGQLVLDDADQRLPVAPLLERTGRLGVGRAAKGTLAPLVERQQQREHGEAGRHGNEASEIAGDQLNNGRSR